MYKFVLFFFLLPFTTSLKVKVKCESCIHYVLATNKCRKFVGDGMIYKDAYVFKFLDATDR
jgi:hypothetical protein